MAEAYCSTAGFDVRGLWRIRLDGGTPVRIADFAGTAPFNPAVALHGNRLAFAHIVPGTSEIMELDSSGKDTPRVVIASASQNTDPSLSPDGVRIAFSSNRTAATQIWVAEQMAGIRLRSRHLTRDSRAARGGLGWRASGVRSQFESRPRGLRSRRTGRNAS